MAVVIVGIPLNIAGGNGRIGSGLRNFDGRREQNCLAFTAGRKCSASLETCSGLLREWEFASRLRSTGIIAEADRDKVKLSAMRTRIARKASATSSFSRTHASNLELSSATEEEMGLQGMATLERLSNALGNARSFDDMAEDLEKCSDRSLDDWDADERVRRSCEAGSSLRVAVLLSGGVDSSVALRLLCNAGHSCTAFYLKIWFQEDFENLWSACPWEDDLSFAQHVCDEAGVELKIAHLTDEYWQSVVSGSISEIQAGRTPNPDMLCNSRIKFGEFLKYIEDQNFDRVASGHYARVRTSERETAKQLTRLFLSADEAKDQTYFLSQLSQTQLSRLMFPLGDLRKREVREIAKLMALPNKQRRDSQGICFLGKVRFSEFVAKHLGEREGALIEAETGDILGVHNGFWFYTIGQRQGIGLSNGPCAKKRRSFSVGSFNWISGLPPSSSANMRCKVRHGPHFYSCTLSLESSHCEERSGETEVEGGPLVGNVTLDRDDQGLAPGQYTAFYQADECLGSGTITEALREDTALNVSPQAFEVAKLCVDPKVFKDVKGVKNRGFSTILLGPDAPKTTGVASSYSSSKGEIENPKGKVLVDDIAQFQRIRACEENDSGERGSEIRWSSLLPARIYLALRRQFLKGDLSVLKMITGGDSVTGRIKFVQGSIEITIEGTRNFNLQLTSWKTTFFSMLLSVGMGRVNEDIEVSDSRDEKELN